ncbi:unnamed protein product [Euphydryas editha]|uniref:Peptidase S1 domain-containing protein n=1 Tax=Euphydryas editha TaxID=104508 RepID=A0AAU9TN27_EUPED|nr:unnamed protein product [Euphydryas editha]
MSEFSTFSATNAQFSTDEIEKILVELLNNNDTTKVKFENYDGKACEPRVSMKPKFTKLGRRVSEAKCYEYIWEMENRENETMNQELCRNYLITQLKNGMGPELFLLLDPNVIFGGRPAIPGEYPHMGAVGWRAKDPSVKWVFFCGSTLISNRFLITAAHCSKLSVRSKLRDIVNSIPEIVRLGVEDIADNQFNINGEPMDIKIKRIIVHPKYAPPKKYYDIALIELEDEVKFGKVQPACLWADSDISDLGSEGTLTGWGYTEHGAESNQLLTANVDFIETPQCDNILKMYRNRNWRGFRSHQLCAGKLEGGIDTCQGDSGGPLQVRIPLKTKGKMYWTVGITSFGIKCGQRNRPGVYTRVSSFIDWIEETVWGSTDGSFK